MATVFDVAQYILAKYGQVDAVKLQKLVYYSQAWHVVAMDTPLFNEPIKAYVRGPVTGVLFHQHRGYRDVRVGQLALGDASALTGEQIELIEAVLAKYSPMTPEDISQLSHDEQPWAEAWEKRESTGDDRITTESMRCFYSRALVADRCSAPRLPVRKVEYVEASALDAVLTSIDEPDDLSGFYAFLEAAGAASSK